jgi:UTP--glucose-1-phosphate uridylyltransferase
MLTTEQFKQKMMREALPRIVVDTFISYYQKLLSGTSGKISEKDLDPVGVAEIPGYEDLNKWDRYDPEILGKSVIIKLNGGLGTTMGLESTKSIIPVKDALTFLDITALQIRVLNKRTERPVPLLLMNSFKTDADTRGILKKYPDLDCGIPGTFIQHKFPRILKDTMGPVSYPQNPLLEWNPPGHGDLYTVLVTSGILDQLISKGYKYAFVSNIDNLGASLDPRILGYFAESGLSFLMEVTDRTSMDRKGGHLARSRETGRLMLREAGQCPDEDQTAFRDILRHRFFNTNNLWIHLGRLKEHLERNNSVLDLPMIRNSKKVDPGNPSSPDVYQLESAMGSAISVFDDASALRVSRDRFAPVKSCEELLLLWSDYYVLTDDYRMVKNPAAAPGQVQINLDTRYYARLDQLKERFPAGAPALLQCRSLNIIGDVQFDAGVKIQGQVSITNAGNTRSVIPSGTVIDSDITV